MEFFATELGKWVGAIGCISPGLLYVAYLMRKYPKPLEDTESSES